jgi:hypothetical protein
VRQALLRESPRRLPEPVFEQIQELFRAHPVGQNVLLQATDLVTKELKHASDPLDAPFRNAVLDGLGYQRNDSWDRAQDECGSCHSPVHVGFVYIGLKL